MLTKTIPSTGGSASRGVGGLIDPSMMGQIIDSAGHTAAQWTALASGLIGTAVLHRLKPQAG